KFHFLRENKWRTPAGRHSRRPRSKERIHILFAKSPAARDRSVRIRKTGQAPKWTQRKTLRWPKMQVVAAAACEVARESAARAPLAAMKCPERARRDPEQRSQLLQEKYF